MNSESVPSGSQSRSIDQADIEWQGDTPVSNRFGDLYFSRDDGAAESDYVFIGQNHLPQRWQAMAAEDRFTIAETGFGTGLNFLVASAHWRAMSSPGQHLHYVSVEKYPVPRDDMARACALRPDLAWISQSLLQQYPAPLRGSHRLQFHQHRITLTLIYEDAIDAFTSLDGTVDAWFLDGFAPAQNPQMWQPELFQQMARLSRPETTFSTFTAAGLVKRGLRDAGFVPEKCRGYGRKRDMLRGVFNGQTSPVEMPVSEKPWFHYQYQPQPAGKAAILGAGMAGCTVARSLADRGWQVSVFESAEDIASGGSGNPTGMTFTKLSLHDTAQNRYYQSAFLHACRYIRELFQWHDVPEGEDWSLQGLLRLAYSEQEQQNQAALLNAGYWPDSLLEGLSAHEIRNRFGFASPVSALHLKLGGWLNPRRYCETLLQHSNITLHNPVEVTELTYSDTQWQVSGDGPVNTETFDAVVMANAFGCKHLSQASHLPLRSVRGQISFVPASETSQKLPVAVNYDGYINPARQGVHSIGATFSPRDHNPHIRVEDHQWNCNQLRTILPELASSLDLDHPETLQGRVGFRCQTPDYLPIVGPLPDPEALESDYADLAKGFLKRPFPTIRNIPGLFVSTGHGSRGITSTCFAAEIIAGYLCGEPQITDRDVVFAVHPARFLIRNLIRRNRHKGHSGKGQPLT